MYGMIVWIQMRNKSNCNLINEKQIKFERNIRHSDEESQNLNSKFKKVDYLDDSTVWSNHRAY